MKKIFIVLILSILIVLAVVTRYYKLGQIPEGFYVDEAGQGYSAYSVLLTGKDEFGKPLPIVFRSLTDFKTPVYIYLIVPLIPIFGLTPFTVRFPSFILSVLTLPLIYYLVNILLPKTDKKYRALLALTTTGLLAISPWHILFGRTNFECNVALFFYISGVIAFYKGLKKPWVLILSALMFAIAIPAYHSQRIITPITLLALFLRHKKTIFGKRHVKYLITGTILAFIVLFPTLSIATSPGFLARATSLNIFSHSRQLPDGFIASYQGFLTPIINGSWFLTTREFFTLYFSYLSPRFMFILGDYGPRSSYPDLSTFYLWQFPFYLYGIWVMFKSKVEKEFKFLILIMLLVSPIPAAVTRDPYTTIRALPLVIPQNILIGLGLTELYYLIKIKRLKYIYITGVFLVFIYSLFKLYSSAFLLNEYYRAKAWDYGWKQVVDTIEIFDKSIPIIVDNARYDAYPQLSFFLEYPPYKYQAENFEVNLSEYYTNTYHNKTVKIGQIITRPIVWQEDLIVDQYLIGDELAISLEQIEEHKLTLVKQIEYKDGTPAFRIVRTNPIYEAEQKRIFNLMSR